LEKSVIRGLAQKARRDGYSAFYTRAAALFRDLAMAPLSEPERRGFREIREDRYQVRSTILTSQFPVSR
jgi:hypothetical protein